jgi:hypothetical protein
MHDDHVSTYLTQMGEMPLLNKSSELAMTRGIEDARRRFRWLVLGWDASVRRVLTRRTAVPAGSLLPGKIFKVVGQKKAPVPPGQAAVKEVEENLAAKVTDFPGWRRPGRSGGLPRLGSRDGALCGPCADRMDELEVAGPWPRLEVADPEACLFGPRQAREERYEDMRSRRRTPVQPSQRRKARPRKAPAARYGPVSYAQAIGDACARAGVPSWHAHQLRHTHATLVRRRFGLEAAQAALGHARADVTQVHAERDLALAIRVAAETG